MDLKRGDSETEDEEWEGGRGVKLRWDQRVDQSGIWFLELQLHCGLIQLCEAGVHVTTMQAQTHTECGKRDRCMSGHRRHTYRNHFLSPLVYWHQPVTNEVNKPFTPVLSETWQPTWTVDAVNRTDNLNETVKMDRTGFCQDADDADSSGRRRGKGWTTQSIRHQITCNLAVCLMFGEQERGREKVLNPLSRQYVTVCQSNKM